MRCHLFAPQGLGVGGPPAAFQWRDALPPPAERPNAPRRRRGTPNPCNHNKTACRKTGGWPRHHRRRSRNITFAEIRAATQLKLEAADREGWSHDQCERDDSAPRLCRRGGGGATAKATAMARPCRPDGFGYAVTHTANAPTERPLQVPQPPQVPEPWPPPAEALPSYS